MIDVKLFWSYVTTWMAQNKFKWKDLARSCGMSVSTLNRKRVGESELTVKEMNCIMQGIGLMPEFLITHNANYGSMVMFVSGEENEK